MEEGGAGSEWKAYVDYVGRVGGKRINFPDKNRWGWGGGGRAGFEKNDLGGVMRDAWLRGVMELHCSRPWKRVFELSHSEVNARAAWKRTKILEERTIGVVKIYTTYVWWTELSLLGHHA